MEILGGPLFSVAGAGESHGPAVTTIVYGCPPGIEISRKMLQRYLDQRRPGSTKHGTPRQESDKAVILSGIYSPDSGALLGPSQISTIADDAKSTALGYECGRTTGEPISVVVLSSSQRSDDYAQFVGPTGEVRPGHTDLLKYHKSQGTVDIRGGGRSSYRSTISDVIGGSVARIFLKETFGVSILSSIVQVGPLKCSVSLADTINEMTSANQGKPIPVQDTDQLIQRTQTNAIRSIDAVFSSEAAELIKQARIQGDSIGAAVEVVAVNAPPLVGEPLYDSLKVRLMGALGGLNAVQSCEIGDGYDVVERRGSENNDSIRSTGYQSNSHGGLIGGITTGMPIVCRVGFKPTSTITLQQESVRKNLEEIDFRMKKGRHDPCVGVRAGITLESRVAIELANAVLMHQASRIDPKQFTLFRRAE